MRAVSPEEAKAAYERWLEWAQKPKEERISIGGGSGPGEWIHDPIYMLHHREKPDTAAASEMEWLLSFSISIDCRLSSFMIM